MKQPCVVSAGRKSDDAFIEMGSFLLLIPFIVQKISIMYNCAFNYTHCQFNPLTQTRFPSWLDVAASNKLPCFT